MENLFEEETLESIYNILKGERKELTKANLMSLIEMVGSNEVSGNLFF